MPDAPYYNGEPDYGRPVTKRSQWHPNCHICHEHTIGHSLVVDSRELALCPNCYAHEMEALAAGWSCKRKGAA